MKFNFDKEVLRENFQRTVIFIGAFILIIIAIKSGEGNVSQQNVSTVVVPNTQEVKQNPYEVAYKKCTEFKMDKAFTNKCVAWELKKQWN